MYWVLVSIILATLLYFYFIKPLAYWSQMGVVQKNFVGQIVNMAQELLQLKAVGDIIRDFYEKYPDVRYSGTYQLLSPVLFLRDPELIKQITVKDFDHFTDHAMFVPEDIEPLWGKNLFALKGERWRDMRATLSPSFTSSKMKGMFFLMNDCAKQFIKHFKKENYVQRVEMKDTFTRLANDVIASTAFGITCDSLKEPNNEFYLMGSEATNIRGFWKNIKIFSILISPTLSKLLGISFFSKKVGNFFRSLVKINIEFREKNGVVRPDMIHLLMEAKNGRLKHEAEKDTYDSGFAVIEESIIGKDEKRQKQELTDDDMTAQALVFFFAGFDSVSTAMCFVIYEIAVNSDIQGTLRKEVKETLGDCGGYLTYDALLKMKYMDMVVSEGLRKWPAQVVIDRNCVKPYTIQPVNVQEKPVHLRKNDIIWLPVYGIHRNPEFFPNPDCFDPERFNDANKSNILPYTYLPFGSGPRSCIGTRFALLEIKTILFHILANFEVVVAKPTAVPIQLARDSITLAAKNGFWFELKPLSV